MPIIVRSPVVYLNNVQRCRSESLMISAMPSHVAILYCQYRYREVWSTSVTSKMLRLRLRLRLLFAFGGYIMVPVDVIVVLESWKLGRFAQGTLEH